MCGIVGWLDWERDLTREETVLQNMTDSLSHRGPDASGYWVTPRAAFGHRRLIVVDPVGGSATDGPNLRQPSICPGL